MRGGTVGQIILGVGDHDSRTGLHLSTAVRLFFFTRCRGGESRTVGRPNLTTTLSCSGGGAARHGFTHGPRGPEGPTIVSQIQSYLRSKFR